MLSNRALAKICGYGAFAVTGIVLLAHEEAQSRIRKSNIYIEAFQFLNENERAVEYFGKPLKAGYANNFDESPNQPDTVCWYKVPLKGPNGLGSLYYKAVKDDKWFLTRVELEVAKKPGKKYLLMERSRIGEAKE